MFRTWHIHFKNGLRLCLCLVALLLTVDQALADDDDDDDDTRAALVFTPDWRPELTVVPGETVENLFLFMARVPGPGPSCPESAVAPLLDGAPPDPGSWACMRLTNDGPETALFRVDFEDTFGAGYRFVLAQDGTERSILAMPGTAGRPALTAGRWMASMPITLLPGARADLFAEIAEPADLADADPVLRPESDFDARLLARAHGFGALLGASALLFAFFVAFAGLLQSAPARRYAVYFGAATLAAASNEGYFNVLVPGNPVLVVGALDKLLEAAQIAAHFFFMAAFLGDGGRRGKADQWLVRLGWVALLTLIGAGAASALFGGVGGVLRYHDVGFELDPLFEDPFASLPQLAAALVSALWYLCVLSVAVLVLRRGVTGGRLFALGAVVLVGGMVLVGSGEDLFEGFDDDVILAQYILLADALIFAAAMAMQTYGLRHERDRARGLELKATAARAELAERLLQSRKDLDRTRALAETHRERLALTGHDLRQPLTSLHLALGDVERKDPELGETLRASLDYLRSVLNATVAESRPDDVSEDDGAYHDPAPEMEPVPAEVLLQNAVRMFSEEARQKGLSITAEPTDIALLTDAVTIIRILSNLVSNAVKYTDSGSVTLRARRIGNGTVALEVEDTGPGFDADELARIRQTNVRGRDVEAIEGDGLGLSSVEGFATRLGLDLRIESEPGKGALIAIDGLREVLSE
ncbi:HAMP domain-containing sensor histidine kinase [Cognatishimia sp. F0-27]|uniref:sensor histidine kinase n=1 Tax=Cognatishimia sp. F0-27 TaxID=2816855 RepID=UPI001D0C67FE|nr:HAMP domain-containing sensor histidine kinase [Cognatishimia sp. F0-27]MCC1493653.1 HAMP domain-containing histidine kinase [Cognatishimia sp. F0-27]